MIEMETSCRRCGRIFRPSADDFRRGVWRICTACRDGPERTGISAPVAAIRPLTGPNNDPEMSTSDADGAAA